MSMKAKAPRSGAQLSLLLQGLILAAGAQFACAASAAEPAQTGLLKLPNVRIENASPAQVNAAAKASKGNAQAGVRAFKDKDSGNLRDQTPEEMVEDGITSAQQSMAKAAAAPAAAITSSTTGRAVVLVDESFMSNTVAVKDASGKLTMECVTGKDAATKSIAGAKSVKEHSHDR
jgi:hypothetical protein